MAGRFFRAKTADAPEHLRAPAEHNERVALAAECKLLPAQVEIFTVAIMPETNLSKTYQAWYHSVGSEEGDAPLLMQALPRFIAQYGEQGLRENAQSMMNEGRPCHWARVACAKSQGKMPTPCFGFVATPPSAEALIQASIGQLTRSAPW
jgi:hypothetical protein